MSPSPIRVGLIGLPGTPADKYEGTNWAASAHLPYLIKSPHYEIVALLNSSVESAQASKVKHGLNSNVKTYGKPEGNFSSPTSFPSPVDLAADPDVDMVICSTRVDLHFSTVKPSILAGKTIFVEWPLESNLSLAREMSLLATKHGCKTIVGLQGSFAEPIREIKGLVDGGRIGKVLGSTMFAALGNSGRTESKNVRLRLRLTHMSVIGEFKTWNSFLINQHPTKDIVESSNYMSTTDSTVVQASAPNNVPDQHLFRGITTSNIPFSMHRRGGAPFPGTPAVEWRIQGEKGEIRLTSSDYFIHMGHPEPCIKIELFVEGEGVSDVHWVDGEIDGVRDEVTESRLPVIARGIARLYEASRKGEWVPDWQWAVKRHEVVEEMWKRYDEDSEKGLAV
ncbi:hypothetical protein ACEPPN_015110 [Leptodophora sp. 'Broadleaf-Isolate-01']